MIEQGQTSISVVMPTANRPGDVRRCLESLASVDYPDWDILVVDQSNTSETFSVVLGFAARLPHLVYRGMCGKGAARARNAAIHAVRGDIIAFLDDDCTVAPDWLQHVNNAFHRHPDAGLVFGSVTAAPHDRRRYEVPVYIIRKERILKRRLACGRCGGMSACMSVRRAVATAVGGIDVHMGAGAQFAGEDRDYTYRILARGYPIVEDPAIQVVHFGWRSYQDDTYLRWATRASYSNAAFHVKMLRCGDPVGLVLMLQEISRCIIQIRWRNLVLMRRPLRFEWLLMYVRGAIESFGLTIDKERCMWGSPEDQIPGALLDRPCETS